MTGHRVVPIVLVALLGCATVASQTPAATDSAAGTVATSADPGAATDSTAVIAALLRANGASEARARLVAGPVFRNAHRQRLDPLLVVGVIGVENPQLEIRSRARDGSVGVMQVQPFWTREIHDCGRDLADVDVNVCFGTRILRLAMDSSATLGRALERYNGCRRRATCDRYVAAVFSKAGRAILLARRAAR